MLEDLNAEPASASLGSFCISIGVPANYGTCGTW